MIVGIDLGTTNSLIAVWEEGGAKLIPNAQGHLLTPSVVSLDDKGNVVVGRHASEQHSLASFKRYMGTNKILHLGEHRFRPEELSALILKSLVRDAEAYLKMPVTEAVITVPAYFNDTQRKATYLAGELAGLKVERLLNEPTAAALAYGLHNREAETKFLIFDLGGGTFDVSIVELFSGVIEVCSSTGDNRLGGEDFTDVLQAYIVHELSPHTQVNAADPRLRHQVQKLLHQLSDKEEVCFQWDQAQIQVTRSQFEGLVKPLIERIKIPLEKALRDARIHPEQLDLVILVGGATRMPVIAQEAAKMFGKFPHSVLHPDEAVALGAAVQAALKQRHQDLQDLVITDVCPYSLGTDVLQGKSNQWHLASRGESVRFLPIIERNTTIPTSCVKRLCTVVDHQTIVNIPIYQGESYNIDENIKIGELLVVVPPRPAGEETFDVRYTYDINGLLEVEVTVLSTGKKSTLTIDNQNHQLTPEEIAASLEKLKAIKIHPRDQLENRQIVAELENLFSLLKGEEREWLSEVIEQFYQALDTQDLETIKHAQKEASNCILACQNLFL